MLVEGLYMMDLSGYAIRLISWPAVPEVGASEGRLKCIHHPKRLPANRITLSTRVEWGQRGAGAEKMRWKEICKAALMMSWLRPSRSRLIFFGGGGGLATKMWK